MKFTSSLVIILTLVPFSLIQKCVPLEFSVVSKSSLQLNVTTSNNKNNLPIKCVVFSFHKVDKLSG